MGVYARYSFVLWICFVSTQIVSGSDFLYPDAVYTEIKSDGFRFFYTVVAELPRAEKNVRLSLRATLACTSIEKAFTKEIKKIICRKKPIILRLQMRKEAFVLQVYFESTGVPVFVVYALSSTITDFVSRTMPDCTGQPQSNLQTSGFTSIQIGYGAIVFGIVGLVAKGCARGVFNFCKHRAPGLCGRVENLVSPRTQATHDGDDEEKPAETGVPDYSALLTPVIAHGTAAALALTAGLGGVRLWCDATAVRRGKNNLQGLLDFCGCIAVAWRKDTQPEGGELVVVVTDLDACKKIVESAGAGRCVFVDAEHTSFVEDDVFLRSCAENGWLVWVQQSYLKNGNKVCKKTFEELALQLKKESTLRFILYEHTEVLGAGRFESNVSAQLADVVKEFHLV